MFITISLVAMALIGFVVLNVGIRRFLLLHAPGKRKQANLLRELTIIMAAMCGGSVALAASISTLVGHLVR